MQYFNLFSDLFISLTLFYGCIKALKGINEDEQKLDYFKYNSVKTIAKITNIEIKRSYYYSKFGNLEVTVEFYIENQKISTIAYHYLVKLNVGDSIDIFYDKNNPKDVEFYIDGQKHYKILKYVIYCFLIIVIFATLKTILEF
jgi:hypothetical protein